MTHLIRRLAVSASSVATLAILFAIDDAGQQPAVTGQSDVVGQSVTRLTDGRWLVVGGIGADAPVKTIAIVEIRGRETSVSMQGALQEARGWHAATMLGDGRILITGGVAADGRVVETAETFDPATGIVQSVPWAGTPRAHHTTTLLRDGSVLIVGGVANDRAAVPSVETFDPSTLDVRALDGPLVTLRQNHRATLMPDGSVKLEGGTSSGQKEDELYDVGRQRSEPVKQPERRYETATLAFVSPSNGEEIGPEAAITLQFTKPLAVQSLERATISLEDESGDPLRHRTILAEGGRLLFVRPEDALVPGRRYRLTARDLFDTNGIRAANVSLVFKIRSEGTSVTDASDEDWDPSDIRRWRTGRDRSPWASLPALRAAAGVTALSGQVLLLNGRPLADVTLKIGSATASTDRTGRFLLRGIAEGQQTLVIDGRPASGPGRTFGVFLTRTHVKDGETTVLPHSVWMPRIDTAHAVAISSPLRADLVITTPRIPGLELHIPKGSIVRDHEGRVAREISITPVPVDRPPFPLPTCGNERTLELHLLS